MRNLSSLSICAFVSVLLHSGCFYASGLVNVSDRPEKPHEVETVIELLKPEYLPSEYQIAKEKKIDKNQEEKPDLSVDKKKKAIENTEIKKEKMQEQSEFEALLRYQDSLKQKVQENRRYPRRALRHRIEGKTKVCFTVLSSGRLEDVDLILTSGYEILDRASLMAVRQAAPFLRFPESITENKLSVVIELVFTMK